MHSVTREQRIRRVIARIGLKRLTADARRLAKELPDRRAEPLRASIDVATEDAGLAVWEWYEEHAPIRLQHLAGDQLL